ncbi:MAG: [protein-PII] uridylyltransferase [Chromatiales bacterium]
MEREADAALVATPPDNPVIADLQRRLAIAAEPISAFRDTLSIGARQLEARFRDGAAIEDLVRERASTVDAIVLAAWHRLDPRLRAKMCLLAVGGYGRGELHPASDIDVMVILPACEVPDWQDAVADFFTFLWDIGLEIGHSVRTVADCIRESEADVTVATTLMESRLLEGPNELYESMREATGPASIWPSDRFFSAKRDEQIARHHRYHDTAYNLEPNVKGSPGGLRDIQMIGWVAKRHFGGDTLSGLVDHGFLTEQELVRLLEGQAFLWRVRFALHILTGRREDRLLFDHQINIAGLLGYEDAATSLAVEQFMQRYYRTVMDLSRLNEMLLQSFEEAILLDPQARPQRIDEHFQVRNGYLEVTRNNVFNREPSTLLKIFLLLQQKPELKGVSAGTIRLLRNNLDLVDEEFRQRPTHHRLFLEILRAPAGVTRELRRMNRYGVLGRYIPAFERIVGRMQYDLFHAYTVDAHTLFVVSNLRRFSLPRFDHEFPFCSEIMQALPKMELAYLAGLFHDIGKGRGGDHSELGAVIAESFCIEQGLSRYDARLVAWLVRHHLFLSVTAQKKDISDPQVISDFALTVGDQTHLDYLYVLTVADVRGTNPKLWNSWKASLFRDFYLRTRQALRRGLENPIDKEELVQATKDKAEKILRDQGLDQPRLEKVWSEFSDDYFLTHSAEEVAWHTQRLVHFGPADTEAVVAVRRLERSGGTAVMVYAPEHWYTFARITAALDELHLSVLDARIAPAGEAHTLDTYLVLESGGGAIDDPVRIGEIEATVKRALARPADRPPRVNRTAPRQVRMFRTPTRIEFSVDPSRQRTVLELTTGDQPGLLCEIGKAFVESEIDLRTAKIVTVGERAEDVFFITNRRGEPLSESHCERLRERLLKALADDSAKAT